MAVNRPDNTLRAALAPLGPRGQRAEQMLDSAADHLNGTESLAIQHAGYALREAIKSVIDIDTLEVPDIRSTASRVIELHASGAAEDALGAGVEALRVALAGRGPNDTRLERVVAARSRSRPTRVTGDRLDQVMLAHNVANEALHADRHPTLGQLADAYSAACTALTDLFRPVSERLAAMDDLVALEDPGPADVARLRERLGDGHPLSYLFDRATGPGWIQALAADELMLPPSDLPWVGGPYVVRLTESHPEAVRTWLRTLPTLDAKQAADLLWIVRQLGGADALGLAIRLAGKQYGSPSVRFHLDGLLRETAPSDRAQRAGRSLIQHLLRETLAGPSQSRDNYVAAELTTMAVAAIAETDAGDWLTMLAHRAREVAERAEPLRLRVIVPIGELHVRSARSSLDLVTAGLRDAAAAAGVPLDGRIAALRIPPDPLASRLVAQHLLDHLAEPTTHETARAFITAQIACNSWPGPEELALLRRLFADGQAPDARAIATALGSPPTAETLRTLAASELPQRPDHLVRAHRWLVAIPQTAVPEWHVVGVALTAVLGAASPDGVMMRVGSASYGAPGTPIPITTLQALGPLEAADRVAAWRPVPGTGFMDPDAIGLAGTLRQAIDADVASWLGGDLVELARHLVFPRYVGTLIEAITDHAEALPNPDDAVDLAVVAIDEPWEIVDNARVLIDPDTGWTQVADAAIKLLGRLGRLGTLGDNAIDRAWTLIAAAAAPPATSGASGPAVELDDGDYDPRTVALNRTWTRALDAALAVGSSAGEPTARLLSLLDDALAIPGRDGLVARAALATQWPWLRSRAPEWFTANTERIFGDDPTLDLYLEYGAPNGALLGAHRDQIVDALGRGQHERAVHHLLHGLLWELPGYEPATVAALLADAGSEVMGDAARWMGTAFVDAPEDLGVEPIVALWRALLELGLEPEHYKQLGWLTINDRIPDEAWLDLAVATVAATNGNVSEPDQFSERAARTPADSRTAAIVAGLLAGQPDAWELQRIGAVGLSILPSVSGGNAQTLRERLLERGFYEARDV